MKVSSLGQPLRKPAGQMYSSSGEVRSAHIDQWIEDDAVMQYSRLAGRGQVGTAVLDHVNSWTSWQPSCMWLALVHWVNAVQCEEAATSLDQTSSYWWPCEQQHLTPVVTCLLLPLAKLPEGHYNSQCATLQMHVWVWLQIPHPVNTENAELMKPIETWSADNQRSSVTPSKRMWSQAVMVSEPSCSTGRQWPCWERLSGSNP